MLNTPITPRQQYRPILIIDTFSFDGKNLPYTPKYEATLSAEYRYLLSAPCTVISRIDLRTVGERYWDRFNSAKQESYQLINLSLSFQRGAFKVTGFINNLFAEEYFTNYVPAYRFPFGGGSALAVNGAPRSFGITLEAEL